MGSLIVLLAFALAFTRDFTGRFLGFLHRPGQLWLSSLDGKHKRKARREAEWPRSSGSRPPSPRTTAGVIAVVTTQPRSRTLNSLLPVGPTGRRLKFNSLTAESGWTSYVMPLSLDLTSDGKTLVYGYQYFTYNYPVSSLERNQRQVGQRLLLNPINIVGELWADHGRHPDRCFAAGRVRRCTEGEQRPYGDEFHGWFDVDGTGIRPSPDRSLPPTRRSRRPNWTRPQVIPKQPSLLFASPDQRSGRVNKRCPVPPTKGRCRRRESISAGRKSIAWKGQPRCGGGRGSTFGGTDV